MGTLNLELNYIDNTERSIDSVVRSLQNRKNDYQGVTNNLNGVSSSTGNLYQSNVYLRKKREKMQGKIDKLNSFKGKLHSFSDRAKDADKRVADYITDTSDTFYKTVGIKTGWAGTWEDIKRGAKKGWKAVKDFYERNKYWIDLVVDLVMLAGALVALVSTAGTGLGLFFAGFKFLDALADTLCDAYALGSHIVGNDEEAEIWAERGLKDGLKQGGKIVDGWFGGNNGRFERWFGFAYDGISAASVAYDFTTTGQKFFGKKVKNKQYLQIGQKYLHTNGLIKNHNTRRMYIEGVKAFSGIDLTPGTSAQGYRNICKSFSLIKNGRQAYKLVRGIGYTKNTITIVKTVNNVVEGNWDKIKCVKDMKTLVMYDSWKEGIA